MGVGQLLAQAAEILQPLPSDQIVQQQHVVLELRTCLRGHRVQPREAARRPSLERRQRLRLVAQQALQAIGDAGQSAAQRLAQRAVPAILVDELAQQPRWDSWASWTPKRPAVRRTLAAHGPALGWPAGLERAAEIAR